MLRLFSFSFFFGFHCFEWFSFFCYFHFFLSSVLNTFLFLIFTSLLFFTLSLSSFFVFFVVFSHLFPVLMLCRLSWEGRGSDVIMDIWVFSMTSESRRGLLMTSFLSDGAIDDNFRKIRVI